MNSLILSAIIFLFFLLPLNGQYKNVVFDRISRQEGFNGQSCSCFLQDHLGYIWIGAVGITKFDGYSFTHHLALPDCINCPLTWNYYIKKMVEDDLGLIWMLTVNGVALYDPEKERTVLLKPPQRPDFNNYFNSYTGDIIKDSKGNIWASNENGLLKITYKHRVHKPVTKDMIFSEGPDSIYSCDCFCITPDLHSDKNKVQSIYEDQRGNMWTGTRDGLYLLKNGNGKFIRIDSGNKEETRLAGKEVRDIIQYDDDSFWIATYSGLTRITNVKHILDGDNQGNISSIGFSSYLTGIGIITSLLKDRSGNLFIGTSENLYIMRKNEKEGVFSFDPVYKNLNDLSGVGYNNGVLAIMQDRGGEIWVAHDFDYIMKFNLKKAYFTSYEDIIRKNFRHFEAISLMEDDSKNLWAGTYLGDLYKIRTDDYKVTKYNPGAWNPIICLIKTEPDKLMLGLEWGILEFDILKGTFSDPIPGSSTESVILKKSRVSSLLKDGNIIYISSDHGIFAFDCDTREVFQSDINSGDSISDTNNHYHQLVKSNTGDIWVTSNDKGISRILFDKEIESLSIVPYVSDKFSNLNILGAENIALCKDKDSILWLGNQHLQKINLKTGEIRTFKLIDDIDYIGIYSILDDNHENLWMGTGFGLCRFNKRSEEARLFTIEDGWPIKGHTYLNAYKNREGTMYFGGEGGFYSIQPDSIKSDNYVPPVVITDMRLMNRQIKIDPSGKGILKCDISYTKSIELGHNQNDISFEFASFDYNKPMKNKYAYKLEGYQNEWIETDAGNRIATFTNLNPGKYTFRVKGSNSDGIWNETGASLSIKILAPWWSTPVAWGFYALLFFLSVTTYIRWRTWHLKKEKSEIEALVRIKIDQVEKQKSEIIAQKNLLAEQNQKIIDLDQVKSRFFSNISHEFRTPLSLIQGPVEGLLNNPRRTMKEREKLDVVYRNARRLLNLVNQLLDISKIDATRMKLEIIESDIIGFLRSLTASFNSLAEIKEISYKCIFPSEKIDTWFDPDKCEKVVVNLLSNAFKFTSQEGAIIFRANYIYNHNQVPVKLQFSVQDNGCGIPEKSLGKIFDMFFQVEESIKKESGGAGIGLSLVKDLVELMHGEITVTSQTGKGSTFSVQFPLGKEHLDKNEYSILPDIPESVISPFVSGSEINYLTEKEDKLSGKRPVLLLVEDNTDIKMHLADNFKSEYNVKFASDGVVGLKKALESIPDLIITDLMMPFMDGIEMCKRLKSDERTCHIPVIMLTAKATMTDKIFGLQTGADDYMPKPFHIAELKTRVNNLIEQRKKLRERFSKEITLQLSDITVTSIDEKFLRKAVSLVEQHLNDEKFDLIIFRQGMNMSSSTLFRKLHALTNQSPTEFIRTLRLKRAASLLSQNFGNITQISLEVGFNNLSYFNKSFKKMFGVTPTEYARNHQV
jgi:signal transduction histidine kinase/DNA-binding response OmpR family regulator/ligand-binding sensor domain-containing protein